MNEEHCLGIAVPPGTDITTVLCPVCENRQAECSQDFRKEPRHKWAMRHGWVLVARPCDECMKWCAERRSEENRRRNEGLRAKAIPAMLAARGVPSKHIYATLDDFPENLKETKEQATGGLLLQGPAGSGKTHFAAAIMRDDLMRQEESEMIDLSGLLMRIRNSFKDRATESELDIVEKYSTIQNLYIDDFGSDKITDFVISTLRLIINKRWGNNLWTVITTNLTEKEIHDVYGERITSRIFGMCDVVYLQGKDRRLEKDRRLKSK